METSFISNPDPHANPTHLIESKRKMTRKIGNNHNQIKWKTQSQQWIYSAKLVQALRHVRRNPSSPPTIPAVRETADRVLAVAAKGRTRWSRAILTRMKINIKKQKVRVKKPSRNNKTLPPLQRKVKVLGRLVPGCRKLSLPNILEEATDYIAALEMQVRAMTALTALLNAANNLS